MYVVVIIVQFKTSSTIRKGSYPGHQTKRIVPFIPKILTENFGEVQLTCSCFAYVLEECITRVIIPFSIWFQHSTVLIFLPVSASIVRVACCPVHIILRSSTGKSQTFNIQLFRERFFSRRVKAIATIPESVPLSVSSSWCFIDCPIAGSVDFLSTWSHTLLPFF